MDPEIMMGTTSQLELTPPLSSKSDPLRIMVLFLLENSQSQPFLTISSSKTLKNLFIRAIRAQIDPQFLGASRPGFYFSEKSPKSLAPGF